MKIFGLDLKFARSTASNRTTDGLAATKRSLGGSAAAWLGGEDPVRDGPVLSNAYEQVVWVYRAINVLAEQVANVPFLFSVGERGRERLITSGPLLDFYARPHPQINRFQYWELRIMWLMLRGECFRVPIFSDSSLPAGGTSSASPQLSASVLQSKSKRRLTGVLILDPARFQHIVEDHQLIGWRYTGLGPRAPLASQVFLPEEVWFEKLPNPFDFWRGLPPLRVAGLAARTDFAAGAFMRGIIENNADTGLIVRTDQWLSDEQREQIVAALRERKRNAGQADRPVLLLGSAEVIRPQLSSSDLQFLENRKFSRAEICAAFGVPEEIVTTTDYAKYDVMAGARLNFIENRIAPLCSRLEAEEDATVKSLDPQASGWFDLDSLPILQEARRSRLAAARTGFEMGVPFNDLNRVLDLGFKPLPWGDTGYVASKLQEVGRGADARGSRRMDDGEARLAGKLTGRDEDLPARAERLLSALGQSPAVEATMSSPSATSHHPILPSLNHDRLLSKLRRFFFEQRGRVLGRLKRAWEPKAGVANQTEGTSGTAALPGREPAATLEAAFDLTLENPALQAAVSAALPAAGAAHLQKFEPLLAAVNQITRESLEDTCRESFAAQETQSQLAERVKAVFNHAAGHRTGEIVAALLGVVGNLEA